VGPEDNRGRDAANCASIRALYGVILHGQCQSGSRPVSGGILTLLSLATG